MSSLCQHILYPNVNVTEYNQSLEQPASAEQRKAACVTGIFPRNVLPHHMVARLVATLKV